MGEGMGCQKEAPYSSLAGELYPCLSLKDGWKPILSMHSLMNISARWTTEAQINSIRSPYVARDSAEAKKNHLASIYLHYHTTFSAGTGLHSREDDIISLLQGAAVVDGGELKVKETTAITRLGARVIARSNFAAWMLNLMYRLQV